MSRLFRKKRNGNKWMAMTIDEVVRAAAKLHISYGEYVRRYDPGLERAEEKPKKRCKRCGKDISQRAPTAQYCTDCAYLAMRAAQNERRRRARKQKEQGKSG